MCLVSSTRVIVKWRVEDRLEEEGRTAAWELREGREDRRETGRERGEVILQVRAIGRWARRLFGCV